MESEDLLHQNAKPKKLQQINDKGSVGQDKLPEMLADMTLKLEEKIAKMKKFQDAKPKSGCYNRLKGGRCQLLRWFGKGCTGPKMRRNCRATCGLC